MKRMLKIVILAFVIAGCNPGYLRAKNTAVEQPDIIAVDILIEPDETTIEFAKAVNERLYKNYSSGFPLDTDHIPHLTIIQCYIRAVDLGNVKAAIAKVCAETNPTTFELTAHSYATHWLEGLGLVSLTIAKTPELLAFQQSLIRALSPFEIRYGTAAAFVPNTDGQAINQDVVDYVNSFVLEHSGKNFLPHITVGLGQEAFVKNMTTEQFDPLIFKPDAVSLYQLGDFGTARKKLWSSAEVDLYTNYQK